MPICFKSKRGKEFFQELIMLAVHGYRPSVGIEIRAADQ
jgi:hypothetical protein